MAVYGGRRDGLSPERTGKPVYAVFFAVSVVFMISGTLVTGMNACLIPVLIGIAFVTVTGCMTQPAVLAGNMTLPSVPVTAPPVSATPPVQGGAECTRASDCVPAECCHPTRCIPSAEIHRVCNMMCTLNCEGPLDCGAGSCGCAGGKCNIVPAGKIPEGSSGSTTVILRVSPGLYSPRMSSTPGIALEPAITGFSAGNATFLWNASYGHFLFWDSPDFVVRETGDSVVNHGEKLYWSFTGSPPSESPVLITVSAREIPSGRFLGNSTVTLAWEGNDTVTVASIK